MAKTAEKPKHPDYITFKDGKAHIRLASPMHIEGAKVDVIVMREPTVNDQIAAEKLGTGGDADRQYLANLCMVAPDDIGRMGLRDFKRLQEAFGFFID